MKTPTKADDVIADDVEDKDKPAAGSGDNGINISPEAQAIIDDLKEQNKLSEAARIEAERRARSAASTAEAASSQVDDTNMQLVSGAIDTVTAAQANLKARYREALAANDYDAAADINGEMVENAANLAQLRAGKAAMEEEKKTPRRRAEPIVVSDPVEDMARTLTPRSAAWVRAHPEYVTDARLNKKLLAAHQAAIDLHEIPSDSDAYFAKVEEILGVKKVAAAAVEEADEALSDAARGSQRKVNDAPPPSLPANKTNTPRNARRLSDQEREAAQASGLTDEEYAANRDKLKAEGRIH